MTKTSSLLDAIKVPSSPFPGLRPFEFNESHLFFGRDGQVEKLIDKLTHTRFLAVVGTSGSGKSSLVRAGLMPALRSGMMTGARLSWRIAVMRPSNDPIGNLARALNAPEVFGSDEAENAAIQIAIAEATLRLGSRGLIETVRQNVMPETENLLVVVDQFEELFRFAREARKTGSERFDNDAAAFVKLLLEAVKPNESGQHEANIFVVLTMRSDFLGDCSQFWDLPEAINESQYLIPRLTRDQLREVIEGPVAVGGGQIAPRLVNLLLNNIADNQDQLPILQHALMRTWDEWRRSQHKHQSSSGTIDLCCYEAIGGMAEALSLHADEALNEVGKQMGRRGQTLAEKMFKCLAERTESNLEVRRPARLDEICAVSDATESEVIDVIDTFRAPSRSFLMPPAGTALNAGSWIDISHESLIRQWDALRAWVAEEAESRAAYLRLADAAARHKASRASFWGGVDLKLALEWREKNRPNERWAERYHSAFKDAMAFLDESQRRRRYKGVAILLLIAAMLVVVWSALNGRFEAKEKERQRTEFEARVKLQERTQAANKFVMKGLDKEMFEDAIPEYQKAIETKDDYAIAYFYRGDAYWQMSKDQKTDEAKADFKRKALADFNTILKLPGDEETREKARRSVQEIESSASLTPTSEAQRARLIEDMFSDDKATRISATTALIHGWKRDPALIQLVINKAKEQRTNTSGVINALVVLKSMDSILLRPRKTAIQGLLTTVENNGPQTKEHVQKLREMLGD